MGKKKSHFLLPPLRQRHSRNLLLALIYTSFIPSDVTTPLEVARFLSEQNANLSANNHKQNKT